MSLPDYRLLYSRYGVEFIPQSLENLQPLPSGIMGPVPLIEVNGDKAAANTRPLITMKLR